MNSQVKEKWVNALRSGEYNQSTGNLKSGNGYCCLGVLCDLYSKEYNEDWTTSTLMFVNIDEDRPKPHDYWYFDGESEFLPEKVMKWAGLNINCPTVNYTDVDEPEYEYTNTVAGLNDDGMNFNQIADLIEEQL